METCGTSAFREGIPRQIGQYEYIRSIGTGEYSVVALVADKGTKQTFACKIMDRVWIREHGLDERVKQELMIQTKLKHPGIVKTFQIIEREKYYFIIMEHCPDGTLFEALDEIQSFNDMQIIKILKKLLEALDYLHKRGISHRDIKLENIVISTDKSPKLIDFGLSYEAVSNQTSMRKTICGTLDYVAPEILAVKEYDGKCSDIWALGICVYALATGHFPFTGTDTEIKHSILLEKIVYPPKVSPIIRRIVDEMTNKDPTKRPTAEQMLETLPVFKPVSVGQTQLHLTTNLKSAVPRMIIHNPIKTYGIRYRKISDL